MFFGTVKFFDLVYGCGFISPDDGSPDAYVHYTSLGSNGFQELQAGQRVSFEVVRNSVNRFAQNIRVLNPELDFIPVK